MATRKPVAKKGYGKSSWTKSEFIDPGLDADQKALLKAAKFDAQTADDSLSRVMDQDYKITVKWDDKGNAYAAWLIPLTDDHENAGSILAGRGSSPLKAIKQVLYKHHTFFGAGFWGGGGLAKSEELDD